MALYLGISTVYTEIIWVTLRSDLGTVKEKCYVLLKKKVVRKEKLFSDYCLLDIKVLVRT